MPFALLQAQLPSSNLPYLFAAFAVTWAIFFLYAFFVTRRQQEMQSEIKELRRVLELRQGSDGA
jgi:CcmD family protein